MDARVPVKTAIEDRVQRLGRGGIVRPIQHMVQLMGIFSRDMAKRDEEGFFYIVDRMKDMILTGGENVYSREVEEVLYTHPSVSEAAVIGLPDPKWGENVVAVIVLKKGMTATEADIIAAVRDRLAGFKKPKKVFFVDELPKTVSGKIIKRELRDRFAGQ